MSSMKPETANNSNNNNHNNWIEKNFDSKMPHKSDKTEEKSHYHLAQDWLFALEHKPTVIECLTNFLVLNKEGQPTEEYKNIDTLEDFTKEVLFMCQNFDYAEFMLLPPELYQVLSEKEKEKLRTTVQTKLIEYYDSEILTIIDAYNRVKAADKVLRENIDNFHKIRQEQALLKPKKVKH